MEHKAGRRATDLVLLLMLVADDRRTLRRTLPTSAPTDRAFHSLLTLRASTARNAADVALLDVLLDAADLAAAASCPAVPALLCCSPIVAVSSRQSACGDPHMPFY